MDSPLIPSANGMRAAIILVLLVVSGCAPRLIDPGPHSDNLMPVTLNDTALIAADGFELPIKRWLPATGKPEAVIVALHGFNDYSNAFADIGAWLASQGIGLYAYDQRGFGATKQAGLWAGSGPMIADLRAMLGAVKRRHRGSRIYALGDSMGGAVIISAWGEKPLAVDGIILVGPAVRGRAVMPPYQQMALWLSAHAMPWLQVSGRGLDIVPSDNIAMLHALGRDPLVIKDTRIDAIWGVVALMDQALDRASMLNGLTLMMYGAKDEIIPPDATLELLEQLPEVTAGQRKIAIYEDGYHMLLRDLNGKLAWDDMVAWIRQPEDPLPSGADKVDPQTALQR